MEERKTSTPLNFFISLPLAVRERRLPKSIPAASLKMRTIGDMLIRLTQVVPSTIRGITKCWAFCYWLSNVFEVVNMKIFDYNSSRWKRKQKAIMKRDGYQCQLCKRYGKAEPAVVVHHIKHVDEYPELAYNSSNLISLCAGCHNKQHPEKATRIGKY